MVSLSLKSSADKSYAVSRAEQTALSLEKSLANLNGGKPSVLEVEQLLIALAVDGESGALYQLEAEQMVAQIKAAFASAMDAPHKYGTLVALASCFSEEADIVEVLGGPPANPDAKAERARYSDARTRVFQQFQRAADALLVRINFRWKSKLQLVAAAICIGLTHMVLMGNFFTSAGTIGLLWLIVQAFVTALLAAFFAPIARDVVAAIGQLRNL